MIKYLLSNCSLQTILECVTLCSNRLQEMAEEFEHATAGICSRILELRNDIDSAEKDIQLLKNSKEKALKLKSKLDSLLD